MLVAGWAQPSAPETLLRQLVDSGALPDLRWPKFSGYKADVAKFYASTGYKLVWVRDGAATAQAQAIVKALQDAGAKGLEPEDYDGSRWGARLAGLRAEDDLVRFDLALTVSVMRYASDLHAGQVNPKVFCFGFDVDQKRFDLAGLLSQRLINAADIPAAMAQVEPPFDGYRRAEKALLAYQALAKEDDRELLPDSKKPVEPGDSYPGVARLERLLRRLGDLPPDAKVPPDSHVYEGVLVDALKHFQERHGIDPDGRIGKSTLKQLNVPLSQRVRQLQIALERWRWVPDSFEQPPIVVNIPEFRLRAYNQRYQIELEMKVVVGGAFRHQTPLFFNNMHYVIFRPYWNVPVSIQKDELLPKLAKDPAYLAKNEYEVVDSHNKVVAGDTVTPEVLAQLRSRKLSIRQVPGQKNALGFVKFIFPNEYDVYLHGTPMRGLFSRARRDFSHGCIRVEKPEQLALWVLRDQPRWDLNRIRKAENGAAPLQVDLSTPIPVLIAYSTAVVKENGEVCFFEDIYGHDTSLDEVLAKGYPYSDWKPLGPVGGGCPRE
jgi:murein L,D-transpeptidase YcbB/YkuD